MSGTMQMNTLDMQSSVYYHAPTQGRKIGEIQLGSTNATTQNQTKGHQARSAFFKMNEVKYRPIYKGQDQMIRCIPEGSTPG